MKRYTVKARKSLVFAVVLLLLGVFYTPALEATKPLPHITAGYRQTPQEFNAFDSFCRISSPPTPRRFHLFDRMKSLSGPGMIHSFGYDEVDPRRLVVMPEDPWGHGGRYRVTLTRELRDPHARSAVYPDEADTYLTQVNVGEVLPSVAERLSGFPAEHPVDFDSVNAASARLDCGLTANGVEPCFPGGLNILFQGAWTDPTSGLAYHRNRWLDPRTASWLSPDPYGAFDSENLYSFAAWGPNLYRDPKGEFAFTGAILAGVAWGMATNFAINEAAREIDYATSLDTHANIQAAGWKGFGRGAAIGGAATVLGGGVGAIAMRGGVGMIGVATLGGGASGFGATFGKDAYNVGLYGGEWSSGEEYALSTTFGAGAGFAFGSGANALSRRLAGHGATGRGVNATVRADYKASFARWRRYADTMRDRGVPVEHIAKRVSNARLAARHRFQKLTPFPTRMPIYARNITPKWVPVRFPIGGKWLKPGGYGNIVGPSWKSLRKRGLSWEEILEGALRPNVE